MKIVRPFAVTADSLTTDAIEATAAWASGTTYAAADEVSAGQRLWSSAQAGNTGHDPETDDGTWWIDIGPNNIWAMFDNKTGTQTTKSESLEVTVDVTGFADTVGLLNIDAAAVNVTVEESGTETFNEDFPMVDDSAIVDYYEYFFEPIIRKSDLVVSGLPDTLNPAITVTLTDSDAVAVGHMVVGQSRDIGATQYGATIGGTDYSRFEEDEFGNTFIVERDYNRSGRFVVWIEAAKGDAAYNLLTSYHATPVLIIAAEAFTSTFHFGLLKDVQIELAYPSHWIISMESRGF